VAKDYYVNYADGAPSVIIPAEQLYRTGKKTGDANLSAFARYLKNNRYTRPDFQPDHIGAHLFRLLKDIFAEEEALAEPFTAPASSWFPGIQVMTARDSGFFVSAKGGSNNESHNHNDIGNFLLYRDGRPVLVDAGVEEYTKFTFNEKRYTLWTMQSCYHNTPRINGADQQAGAEYRASGVSFSDDGREVRFSLELAGAYGADAALEQYRRELVFHREGDLRIRDTYRLKEWKAPLILNLLCYDKPKVSRGRVSLGRVVLFFDAALCAAEYEPVLLKDDKIRRDWNKDKLYRLRLIKNGKDLSGTIDLRFTR
jgi:hypothetical protein